MQNSDLDVLFFLKFLRSPRNQLIDIADNTADIIGDPSGGVRCIFAAFECEDFKI
jgi:hypothetical protein